jgi:hypothetical protein
MTGNKYIIRKVAITETFRNLPIDQPVTFSCKEAAPINSAYSAACRLNKKYGEGTYTVTPIDNGASYTVIRSK